MTAFEALSAEVAEAGRLQNATSYLRLTEFFTPTCAEEKVPRYRRYRELFNAAFADSGVVRHDVGYAGSALPAYWLGAIGGPSQGVVLLHGGFDSLIEEFFAIWQPIAAASFDVVAFEGPGQGGARALGGLTFDHEWESPSPRCWNTSASIRPPWSGSRWAAPGCALLAVKRASTASCPGRRCMTGCTGSRPGYVA